jgi:hypothetical protein
MSPNTSGFFQLTRECVGLTFFFFQPQPFGSFGMRSKIRRFGRESSARSEPEDSEPEKLESEFESEITVVWHPREIVSIETK